MLVATAPTVYGIETLSHSMTASLRDCPVATAPTVYGIETKIGSSVGASRVSLQQHLPFTVLKLCIWHSCLE